MDSYDVKGCEMSSSAAAPVRGGPAPARRSPRGPGRGRRWIGWGFVLPFVAVFALVFLAPIAYSVYLSLFRDQLIGGNRFVGLDNYRQALTDHEFWSGLGRVALFLAVQVPVMLGIALLAALAIGQRPAVRRHFFRISIFLPYAVPAVVATLMWGFMYGNRFGLVASVNDHLHTSIRTRCARHWVLLSIGNIVTWEFVGYNMLIFYSALRVVPASLYEAAEIDGAGQWRIIRSIKIPAIRGALVIATVFSVIGSFQLFNEPSILKSLAPNAITTYFTPNLYTYSLSFSRPAVQLRRHGRDPHGRRHHGRRLRRTAARHAQGEVSPWPRHRHVRAPLRRPRSHRPQAGRSPAPALRQPAAPQRAADRAHRARRALRADAAGLAGHQRDQDAAAAARLLRPVVQRATSRCGTTSTRPSTYDDHIFLRWLLNTAAVRRGRRRRRHLPGDAGRLRAGEVRLPWQAGGLRGRASARSRCRARRWPFRRS